MADGLELGADDKARRNLVLVSAAMLLIAWMDIPVGDLIQAAISKGGVQTGPKIDSWRAWFAALVVMWYLMMRYRFSDQGKRAEGETIQELSDLGRSMFPGLVIYKELDAQNPQSFSAYLKQPLPFEADFDLEKLEPEAKFKTMGPIVAQGYSLSSLECRTVGFNHKTWTVTCSVTFTWVSDAKVITTSAPEQVRFSMRGWRRYRASLLVHSRLWLYSESGVVRNLPVVLAICAVLVGIWKAVLAG